MINLSCCKPDITTLNIMELTFRQGIIRKRLTLSTLIYYSLVLFLLSKGTRGVKIQSLEHRVNRNHEKEIGHLSDGYPSMSSEDEEEPHETQRMRRHRRAAVPMDLMDLGKQMYKNNLIQAPPLMGGPILPPDPNLKYPNAGVIRYPNKKDEEYYGVISREDKVRDAMGLAPLVPQQVQQNQLAVYQNNGMGARGVPLQQLQQQRQQNYPLQRQFPQYQQRANNPAINPFQYQQQQRQPLHAAEGGNRAALGLPPLRRKTGQDFQQQPTSHFINKQIAQYKLNQPHQPMYSTEDANRAALGLDPIRRKTGQNFQQPQINRNAGFEGQLKQNVPFQQTSHFLKQQAVQFKQQQPLPLYSTEDANRAALGLPALARPPRTGQNINPGFARLQQQQGFQQPPMNINAALGGNQNVPFQKPPTSHFVNQQIAQYKQDQPKQMYSTEDANRKALGLAPLQHKKGADDRVKVFKTDDLTYLYTKLQGTKEWTGNVWEVEVKKVNLLCPKETFIAELTFEVHEGKEAHFTIEDKIAKKLSPEKVKAKYLIQKEKDIDQDLSRFHQGFEEMVQKQNPLSESGCDPIINCLGHQSCLFMFRAELCALSPKRSLHLKLTYKCVRDSLLTNYVKNAKDRKVITKEMEQSLNLRYSHEKSNEDIAVIELKKSSEDEIFGVSCPPVSDVYKLGYGGVCTIEAPPQGTVANDLWNVLGRVPTKVCREELYQAYCAYHYNTSGGCVPPALIQPSKEKKGWKPGELVFSFQAMPQVGNRPDTSEFENRMSDPHVSLIPATIGFLVLSHDHPDAVMQLVQGIYRPYHFYAIHVDYRQDKVREEIVNRIKRLYGSADNIRVIPKERSFVASWGSYYILRAELECFEELLRMGVWDFAINLSGADLPIRDVDDVSAALATARGHNFMRQNGNWNDRDDRPTDFATWYGCGAHVYNVSLRGKRPGWSDMHSTSQWGIFSRDFIELMISPDRPEKMKVLQFFAMTCIIPDESFLASMIKVSPFKNTFIHGNMHFLKQFDRRDDRGFCRHTEDIDFCGQGPGKFEPGDMDTILIQSNNLAFARKFEGDVTSPVRLYALEIAAGKYYEELKHKQVTEEMLRQMVSLALEAEYGESWETEAYVEDLLKLRVIPQLLPLDPCCMPIYNTKNQLVHDVRYWLDFSVVESKTGERRILRTSLVHQSRTKCFSRGHIKALYITTKQGTQGKRTQVPAISPIPSEPAGSSVLYLTSYVNLSDRTPKAPECNEVEGIPDDSYEGRSPDSFNYAAYTLKAPEKQPLRFNATLISPTGEVKCFIEVVIAYKKPPPSLQKRPSGTTLMTKRMECGPLSPGMYTLVLFQLNVKDPFPYTAQIYLRPRQDKTQRWNLRHAEEDGGESKPGDLLYGLWTVEEIRELPEEEVKRYNYDKINQEPEKEQAKHFFHDKDYQGHNENEDDSVNDNAKEEDDGDDTNDEDDDDDDDGDDSSIDEKEQNRPGMRPPHRRVGGGMVGEKQPPKFGGEGPEQAQGDNNEIKRGRRGEQGPIEGIRHAMGHDDTSMHFFKNVEKNGRWKKQTLYFTLLEFFGISAVLFLFIKGVLVPLRIVKRGSSGFKSFGLFVAVVTLLQFLIYTLFSISTAS